MKTQGSKIPLGDISMEERCEKCKYWDNYNTGEGNTIVGFCKRYPTYVERKFNDYCGEFTPKDSQKILHD